MSNSKGLQMTAPFPSNPKATPKRYFSRATFSDPDGNGWPLEEITTRRPGRIDPGATSFGSPSDLASALRRVAAAHGEHEKRTGKADANWPDWYAEYMVAETGWDEVAGVSDYDVTTNRSRRFNLRQ